MRLPLAAAVTAAALLAVGAPGAAARPVSAEPLLEMQLVLPWRDAGALRQLVDEVSDPAGPHYRDYLTPATFRTHFAPSERDVSVVAGWLRGAGLEVGAVSRNRMVVPARGPASVVRRAAALAPSALRGLVIGARVPADEPPALPVDPPVPVPDQPATPADSTPPAAVVFGAPCSPYDGAVAESSLPKFAGRHQPAVTCATTVAQQRAAYGVNPAGGNDGTGQTVVMVGSHGIQTLPADLNEWSRRRGLPVLRPGQLTQITYPSAYQTPTAEPVLRPQVWALQSHMIFENIHAMAPGADLVYVGTPSSFDLQAGTLAAVDAKLGDVVMNGWYTAGENTNPAQVALISQIAEQAAATGISLLFASGSTGDNSTQGGTAGPVYPANDPMVTAVGATSLIVGKGGRLVREVGWAKTTWTLKDGDWDEGARNTFRGSGGGLSTVQAQPAYQAGVVPDRLSVRKDGTKGRAVPDVAVNGDAETGLPIGMTQRFPDGTDRYAERRHASDESATGVFAALVALANQRAGKDLGFLNPLLYSLANKPGGYRDIVASGRPAAGVRTDFVNGANGSGGVKKVLKVLEQYDSNVPVRGYDWSSGLGAPGPSWLRLLTGK